MAYSTFPWPPTGRTIGFYCVSISIVCCWSLLSATSTSCTISSATTSRTSIAWRFTRRRVAIIIAIWRIIITTRRIRNSYCSFAFASYTSCSSSSTAIIACNLCWPKVSIIIHYIWTCNTLPHTTIACYNTISVTRPACYGLITLGICNQAK